MYRLRQHGYPPPDSSAFKTISSEIDFHSDDAAEQGDIPETGDDASQIPGQLHLSGQLVAVPESDEQVVAPGDSVPPITLTEGRVPLSVIASTLSLSSATLSASGPSRIELQVLPAHSTTDGNDSFGPGNAVGSPPLRRGGFRRFLRKLACW